MDYKIITANTASFLTAKVKTEMLSGWKIAGGHQVVEIHHQPKYAGRQLMQTVIKSEYSQTLIKEHDCITVIFIDNYSSN